MMFSEWVISIIVFFVFWKVWILFMYLCWNGLFLMVSILFMIKMLGLICMVMVKVRWMYMLDE